MIRGREPKNISVLIDEYQCPQIYKDSKLRHGELTMDPHLLYEYSCLGDSPEMRQAFHRSNTTFYRNDVLLSMPHIEHLRSITDELENNYTISKSRGGYICPKCKSSNTTLTSIQLKSCDEQMDRFLYCNDCKTRTKNPVLVAPKDQK